MALYAMGDLHLSLGVAKPMDVFGGVWEGYLEKLNQESASSGRGIPQCCWETSPGGWI